MKYAVKYFFLISFLYLSVTAFAQTIKQAEPQTFIKFTENKNQWEPNILFRAFLDGGSLFLEKNKFTYNFYNKEALHHNHVLKEKQNPLPINSHAFTVTFLNAEKNV
ncbi:MAG: hypothetical protein JNL69_08740, partial [Bacteroidia bacterium]|nr:hypothetical protein [Bacteroidia bacterium]